LVTFHLSVHTHCNLGYRSLKIIGNGIIRYIAYEFLLEFRSNYGAISYRLRDIAILKALKFLVCIYKIFQLRHPDPVTSLPPPHPNPNRTLAVVWRIYVAFALSICHCTIRYQLSLPSLPRSAYSIHTMPRDRFAAGSMLPTLSSNKLPSMPNANVS